MDEQQLNAKTIAELRDLAETAGIKSYKALRKQGLIEALLAGYNAAAKPKRGRKSKAELANSAEAALPAAEETVPPQSEPQPAEGAESAPLPQAAEKAESAAPAQSAQEAPKSAAQGKPAAGHTARKPQTSESRRTRLQAQHATRSHGQGEKSGPFAARNHANKVKNNHPPENRPVQEKPAAPAAQNEEETRRREVENRPA